MIKTVGIVGHGHFGKFVHELGQKFFPDIEFRIYSRRAEVDDVKFYSLEKTAQSDVVILCSAIREYEAQLVTILKHVAEQTVLIDVATVKKHTSELCQKHCGNTRFISTHPMFGPESFKKSNEDISGFRIVVTDIGISNEQYQYVKNIFATLGFLIIEMSADEHDERLAETLFLTHYVGQSLVKADFKRTEIDTVSFSFLMNAVESVKSDTKLFEDVFEYNPYCKKVVERLHTAQEEIYQSLQK